MSAGFSPENFKPKSVAESNPNISNVANSGVEKEGEFTQSVKRSKTVKQATGFIIHTRSQLTEFLAQQHIKLLTSAVEYQSSGDFIQSSYVVFSGHGNHQEPLSEFLSRYPQLIESVENINNQLKEADTQSHLKVKQKEVESNPFQDFMK